jgi:hypothetical protein
MSAQDRSFNENLDLLIKLLRRMKDKSQFKNVPGLPPMFFANFEYFVSNYEQMKQQISEQLLQQFGEPIKQIVADMVDHLQSELGESYEGDEEIGEATETPVITGHKRTVAEIDEMLKKPGLSENEIDKLLDERKRVMSDE